MMRTLRKVLFTSAPTYNIGRQDDMLLVSATCAITLPSAVGQRVGAVHSPVTTIKKTFAGSTVIINAAAGQTIDGNASYTLTAQQQYVTLVSNGANWLVLGNN
jgi:hypothetical protein